MSHDTHHGHPKENKTIISFKNSFWLVIILVGLFVAALNFVQAEGKGEEGEHHEGTHTEANHEMHSAEHSATHTEDASAEADKGVHEKPAAGAAATTADSTHAPAH